LVSVAVAAISIFAIFDSMQATKIFAQQYPDAYGAARAETRFAPLLAKVPPNAALGYLTDLESTHQAYSAAFLAAQYALAPRQLLMLSTKTRPEWALGNFTKPVDFGLAGAEQG